MYPKIGQNLNNAMVLEDKISAVWYEDPDRLLEPKVAQELVRIPTVHSQISLQELNEINKQS